MVAKRGTAWLGEQLGISRQAVEKHVKTGRIPRKASYSNADAKQAKAALADARANANATMTQSGALAGGGDDQARAIQALRLNPEKAARVKLIIERTVAQQLDNREKQGQLLDADEVERGRAERVLAVKEAMASLVHTLPPRLVGLGAAAMESIIETELRGVCNRFAGA